MSSSDISSQQSCSSRDSGVKSQSSEISIQICNENDENVVIQLLRNEKASHRDNGKRRNKNIYARQAGGGSCYPNDENLFQNLYRKTFGPTLDETILAGMEALQNSCGQSCECHCGDSRERLESLNDINHIESSHDHDITTSDNTQSEYYAYEKANTEESVNNFAAPIVDFCECSEANLGKPNRETRTSASMPSPRKSAYCMNSNLCSQNSVDSKRSVLCKKSVLSSRNLSSNVDLMQASSNRTVNRDVDRRSTVSKVSRSISAQDAYSKSPVDSRRNMVPKETRFAITRVTKYDDFTTYEVLKSTKAKPKVIPCVTENIFIVKGNKSTADT